MDILGDYFANKRENFQILEDRASILRANLEEINTLGNKLETEKILFKEAFNQAANHIEEIGFNILFNNARIAMLLSGEYNYEPYVVQMESALRANKNLIALIPNEQSESVSVSVDLSELGTAEDWALAVNQAREVLKLGLKSSIESRSIYWMTHVYGPARGGLKIVSYDKKGNKKDRTEFFAGLYPKTITVRLSFLEANKAPFWELVEYGNAPGIMPDDGGEAYPKVKPQRFIEKTQRELEREFLLAYYRFKGSAATKYSNLLQRQFRRKNNVSVAVEDIKEALDIVAQTAKDLLFLENEPVERLDLSAVTQEEELTNVTYQEFIVRGKRTGRFRGPRGFISLK